MKIATAAYALDFLQSWAQYEDKLSYWVAGAAGQGADLLLFPEYGGMEIATLAGSETAGDLERSVAAISERMGDVSALYSRLAREHGVYIVGGGSPVWVGQERPVNRSYFYAPDGGVDYQDKQIMIPWERDPWHLSPGGPLKLFDTEFGKIGILICYDCEFPLLARALADADLILVPSCTEALHGYWRVRIGAMARALEGQCVTAMSSLVGMADWSEAVDVTTGAGGVFGPPDTGFPANGVLAAGEVDVPGWTFADFDAAAIARVRHDGAVRNRIHWPEQEGRIVSVTNVKLR